MPARAIESIKEDNLKQQARMQLELMFPGIKEVQYFPENNFRKFKTQKAGKAQEALESCSIGNTTWVALRWGWTTSEGLAKPEVKHQVPDAAIAHEEAKDCSTGP